MWSKVFVWIAVLMVIAILIVVNKIPCVLQIIIPRTWLPDFKPVDLKPDLQHIDLQTLSKNLQQRHPNFPLELLNGDEEKHHLLLPTISSIEWRNEFWQMATLNSGDSFFLYSAFFDPETGDKASIRLLGVSRSKYPAKAWCQIWFSSDVPPLTVRVTNVDYLDYQKRNTALQMPFLLRCPLPPNTTDVPLAVSLTSEPSRQATNILKVFGGRKREASAYRTRQVPDNPTTLVKGWAAAVCGPALYYYHEDFSLRIVEWLELLRAQGFSQVFLYVTDVHPNITKVLHHYTKEGFVQVIDYTYPPPFVNDPALRRLLVLVERGKMFAQENIYFTDCVLRHMHQYRFLTHFDPDELPILPHHDNFTHLLDEFVESTKGKRAPPGFRFHWSYFFNNLEPNKEAANLPTYLWMLRHTGRQANHSAFPDGVKYKPVYDMNIVRGVYSHGSIVCLTGFCDQKTMVRMPSQMAFLGHFKRTCDEDCQKNNSMVHDLTLHRYKEQVHARVLEVLTTLQLL